jgi:predicted short-subunit dehydrogenase-like oxidoreductase (DUF2520 family)
VERTGGFPRAVSVRPLFCFPVQEGALHRMGGARCADLRATDESVANYFEIVARFGGEYHRGYGISGQCAA